MARPNSLLTKVRALLARLLDPWPDVNEGWCMDCTLNGGKTVIVPVNGVEHHSLEHRDADPTEFMKLRWSQPSQQAGCEESSQ